MPFRGWILAGLCALAVAGCGAPAALLLAPPSPPGEALAWFPEDSVAVALVGTDPDGPGLPALIAALERKAPGLVERLPDLAQVGPLLGEPMAVGIAAPGLAPLAVLATGDEGTLDVLAQARVMARLAAPAGAYRGADLFAAEDHAFATRGDVLLVSATTADLRRALDRRATEDGLSPEDLPAGDARIRARIDPRPLLAKADARLRAIPWLAAADRLELTAEPARDHVAARLVLRTGADALVPPDVPVTGGRAPRTVDVRGDRVAVRDARHLIVATERATTAAAPFLPVRIGRALPAARALASTLDGPATLVRRGRRLLLRADPRRPGRMAMATDRLAAALLRSGVPLRRRDGFYEVAANRAPGGAVRFGVREGTLVAGTVPARALERLARAPLARPAGARGSLAFRLPGRGVTGWARGNPRRTVVELRLALP